MTPFQILLTALGLITAVFLGIALILVLLVGWPILLALAAAVLLAAAIGAIVLGILVSLSAIPFYFLKRKDPEWGDYRLEDLKDPNDRRGR